MTDTNLDIRCNSCGKPIIFHTRFATWICKLFTRLEGIPATYVAKPVFVRKPEDNPIEPDELRELKQGPCERRP